MKLTAQEEWGLRCLLRIGRAGDGASLTIGELARSEAVTQPNVAKTMRLLRRAGFVRSTRGKEGGYTLARPPAEINLGEVVSLLGGRFFDATFCERHAGLPEMCANLTDCSIRSLWATVQSAVDSVLGRMTLADLLGGSPTPARRGVPLRVLPHAS